jgi:GAF domain-containing protein
MGKDAEYLKIFIEISKTITTTLAVEQRLKIMAEGLAKALQVKGCTIRLLDDAGKTLELVASYGLSKGYFQKGAVEADKSIAEAMLGRTVVIRSAATDSRIQYPEAVRKEGIVSILTIPIIVREKVIGVLKLHTAEERDFQPEDIEFAGSLAEQCGLAIENARLFEQALNEVEYLKTVTEVARALSSTLDAPQILDLIVTKAIQILDLKACSVRLLNPKSKRLELACSRGLSPEYLNKGPVDMDRSLASTMTGAVVWIEDAATDTRLQYPQRAKQEGIASMLSVPMLLQDKVVGVLRLYTAKPRRFVDSQIELAQSLAEFGAVALQNARLHENLRADYQAVMEDIHLFRGYTVGL